MLYPVEKLLPNKGQVVTVNHTETVRDALHKMVQHDFSQLPIVNDHGDLVGMISVETIARTYFHLGEKETLSVLPVQDCRERPLTLTPEADLFEALDLLQKAYAIVIVEGRKPIGILTNYDTIHFFRNITEGLLIVEDIETTLRQYIEAVFKQKNQMQAALMRAFKPDKQDSTRPARTYDKLNFHQHIQLITTEGNWSHFEPFFKPKNLFTHYMEGVNQIRNQLAHFRDEIDAIQADLLRLSRDWLEHRPKPPLSIAVHDAIHLHEAATVQLISPPAIPSQEAFGSPVVAHASDQGKYAPLTHWLATQRGVNALRVTFDQLDALLAEPLPQSARQHRSWWSNEYTTNLQSLAWLRAGWQVENVDFAAETITFRQSMAALQQLYFADLLDRLKQTRPGLTRATKAHPQNWWSFGGGRSGFIFGWVFATGGLLRVELYIDTGDQAVNKRAFAQLQDQKDDIEKQIGQPLKWEPLERKRACRISVAQRAGVNDPPEAMQAAKTWALTTMIRFVDIFQPRIRALNLD
jgi:hypothetical protein